MEMISPIAIVAERSILPMKPWSIMIAGRVGPVAWPSEPNWVAVKLRSLCLLSAFTHRDQEARASFGLMMRFSFEFW